MVHTAWLLVLQSGPAAELFPDLGAQQNWQPSLSSMIWDWAVFTGVNMLLPNPKGPTKHCASFLMGVWVILLWRECSWHIPGHWPLKSSLICETPTSSVCSCTLFNVSMRLPIYSGFFCSSGPISSCLQCSGSMWCSCKISRWYRSFQTRLWEIGELTALGARLCNCIFLSFLSKYEVWLSFLIGKEKTNIDQISGYKPCTWEHVNVLQERCHNWHSGCN